MIRVTQSEAHQQLLRLIAVFPRHGMDEMGVIEYSRTMAGFFAGEWHMRKVVDAAKEKFRYFPSLAELRELADDVSAKGSTVRGCDQCTRSVPGMAYVTALWTPGSDGKPGRLERITDEAADALRPEIEAARATAKAQGRDYLGMSIVEKTAANAAVGYCTCQAGTLLREQRLARQAQEAEKRAARSGSGMRASDVRLATR